MQWMNVSNMKTKKHALVKLTLTIGNKRQAFSSIKSKEMYKMKNAPPYKIRQERCNATHCIAKSAKGDVMQRTAVSEVFLDRNID